MISIIRNRKILVIIILLFILCISLVRYGYRAAKRNFCDFHVNYIAAKRILSHGNLYDFWKSGLANFKYPPFFAFLMTPLGLLDEFSSSIVWYIINFILLIISFKIIKNMLNNHISYAQSVFLYTITTMLGLRFILQNFDEGQVNILMMSSLIFSIYFLTKNKELIAGSFFGFSVLIKYMPLILLPYFIFKRKFKFLATAFIFLIIYSILPALFIGWDYNLGLLRQFIPFVFTSSTDTGSISTPPNQSLLALLMRFLSAEADTNVNFISLEKSTIILIFFALFIIFYLLIILNRYPAHRFSQLIDYALLLICIAFFNPNSWKHAFIFLIFGYMILLYYLIKVNFKDNFILTIIILSLILCSFTPELPILPKDFFESYSAITFGALLVFFGLLKIKFSKNLLIKQEL